jgi:uncharacterized protein involved in exopolysaccharide biosynthesis
MTQVRLITSEQVLNAAVADARVASLPTIKKSADPKSVFRKALEVEILNGTNLIRVALDLPNPEEAATIVNAVVQSYLAVSDVDSRTVLREMTESVSQQLAKLRREIEEKREQHNRARDKGAQDAFLKSRDMLNDRTETDPLQPTFRGLTHEQYTRLIDRQVQCDIEYLEAVAELEAIRVVRARNLDKLNEELEIRVADEFRKVPKVAALMDQMDDLKRRGDSRDQPPTPAALAAREKLRQLSDEYGKLWAITTEGIRKRLAAADQGVLSEAKIRERELAVEKARRKKELFAQQFEKIQVNTANRNDDTFELNNLNHEIESLVNREEALKNDLRQLQFEAEFDRSRVDMFDPASAPRFPTNNRRQRSLAAVPVVVLCLVLCLFLARESVAGRTVGARPAGMTD